MIDLKQLRRRISGKPTDQGVYGPTWLCPREALKLIEALEAAQKDQARYQWLRTQKSLTLESSRMLWTREDGSKFHSTHYLASGDTQHSSLETLDETIDAAMTAPPATEGEQ